MHLRVLDQIKIVFYPASGESNYEKIVYGLH